MIVRTIPFPEKLFPRISNGYFKFELLEIDGKSEVLEELMKLRKNNQKDFKKLLATLVIQVHADTLIKDQRRLNRGIKCPDILEYKSNKGSYRLFGFLGTDNKIIICTNTYNKTTSKKKKQDAAFEKAKGLKSKYDSYVRREECQQQNNFYKN